jgi:hypothetical protein
MIARMCEQFIGRSADPFRLDVPWPFAYAARGATNRALVRLHATVTLDAAGRPAGIRREPIRA